jgi:Thiamine pyrophosphate enzyme, N-terminal TPP binding domain
LGPDFSKKPGPFFVQRSSKDRLSGATRGHKKHDHDSHNRPLSLSVSSEDEGITHLFGNPGTTELLVMHAPKDHPELSYVMAMQESLVVAMADGFSRASGHLVACDVHIAPGLGNAFALQCKVHRHADDLDRRPAGAGPRAHATLTQLLDLGAWPRNSNSSSLQRAACSVRCFSARAIIRFPNLTFPFVGDCFRFGTFKASSVVRQTRAAPRTLKN